jgi:Lrp/AsnC family leucine-responsive transcriptional regulator
MNDNIDLKDRKILYELDLDSRQSFAEIGKKVGLSKNSVINRINNLRKDGIIKNFHAWLDLSKLGYMQFRIYLNLEHADPKKEQEIIDFLCKKKIVTWVGSMEGPYNIGVKLMTKNLSELHQFWDELFNKYINYIEERLLTIIAETNYYYKAYLPDLKKSTYKESLIATTQVEEIDNLDKEIISILTKDARTSILNIAEKLKVTPKTIISRIKTLEKKNIIIGYGTVINISKLGYQSFKISFILSRLTEERMKYFKEYANQHPNIVYDEEATGGDDYEIEVHVQDTQHLRSILYDIKTKFSDIISDYKISNVFESHKHIGFPEGAF